MTVTAETSRQLERSIVGALLDEPERLADALEVIDQSDFHDRSLQAVFVALTSLDASGANVDLVSVVEWLKAERTELVPKGGWHALVLGLNEAFVVGANLPHWCRMLSEKSTIRAAQGELRRCAELLADVHVGVGTELLDALDEIEGAIQSVGQRRLRGSDVIDLRKLIPQLRDEVLSGKEPPGLQTYIHDLDDIMHGMRGGELIIVAARPRIGKTTLAVQVAINVAQRGAHVMLLSLEMSSRELAERMLANLSSVSSESIRARRLNVRERDQIVRASDELQGLPVATMEGSATTVAGLRAHARRRKRAGALDLIIVDYVQLMADPSYRGNRVQEVGAISRGLKGLARELDVPIIALSQLSRAGDERRPSLSHLRESGDLEQDGDVVLMLWRKDEHAPLSCAVEKNRHGRQGVVRLAHLREVFKVAGLSSDASGGSR